MKKKRNFKIPQIKEINKEDRSIFVSPYFGSKNKDEIVIPKDPLRNKVVDRLSDFQENTTKKNKQELEKEFNIPSGDEVREMITTRTEVRNKDSFVKVSRPKVEEKSEPIKEDIEIPFGLENDTEELTQNSYEEDVFENETEQNEIMEDIFNEDYTDSSENNSPDALHGAYEDNQVHEDIYVEDTEPDSAIQQSLDSWFDIGSENKADSAKSEKEETIEPTPLFTDEEIDSDTEEIDVTLKQEVKEEEPKKVVKKEQPRKQAKKYVVPPLSMLEKSDGQADSNDEEIKTQEDIINNTLAQFGVGGKVVNYTHGPTVTQFEVKLDDGVMVNKVTNIENNMMMNLAAEGLRIEAPILGKTTVGIEVPNRTREIVKFGDLIDEDFINNSKPLEVVLGVDLGGQAIKVNIEKMPHGLIAGATGSGKSVCLDTMIISLLMKSNPEDLRMVLIDPKMVGFAAYSQLPHLAAPIIFDAKLAAETLNMLVQEMERRYKLMFQVNAKSIERYNHKVKDRLDEGFKKEPYMIIIIEEMADLMAQAAQDVEVSIQRLAQKARAAGIYLIVATQRPSTDVIRGTMKSNIPTRIALKVSSYTDSMTIIDYAGAEKLLGNGDMLIKYDGKPLKRIQGAYVSEDEIDDITEYLSDYQQDFIFDTEQLEEKVIKDGVMSQYDELFLEVAEYVVENNYASINKIQKHFNIGYNRAEKIFVSLTEEGIVSSPESKTPRKVLITMEQFKARYFS